MPLPWAAEEAGLKAYWLTLVAFSVLFGGVVVGIVAALLAIAGAIALRRRDRHTNNTNDPETVVRRP